MKEWKTKSVQVEIVISCSRSFGQEGKKWKKRNLQNYPATSKDLARSVFLFLSFSGGPFHLTPFIFHQLIQIYTWITFIDESLCLLDDSQSQALSIVYFQVLSLTLSCSWQSKFEKKNEIENLNFQMWTSEKQEDSSR